MTADPDPFEEGQRAARENIPAETNPYQDGSEQHSLWSAGHEQVAGEAEANKVEGRAGTAELVRGYRSPPRLTRVARRQEVCGEPKRTSKCRA